MPRETATRDDPARASGKAKRPTHDAVRREIAGAFVRHHAVVIAIDDYGDPSLRLRNAVADGRAVAERLVQDHDFEVTLLTDGEATNERIRAVLEETLPAKVGADDRVLVYVAGHGTLSLTDDGPLGFLLFHGARRGDPQSYFRMQALSESLSRLACRHLLLVLDCCFAGAFHWAARRDFAAERIYREQFERYLRFPAWQAITSSATDETALDTDPVNRADDGGHSPFARAFLDGLSGRADLVEDGVIVATELYLYVRGQLDALPSRVRGQTPGLFPFARHGKGEFIFARPGAFAPLPPAPRLGEDDNPYRGLQAFDSIHKDLFFGRSRVVNALASVVNERRLTIALGASGVGKSSLVRAGLIPAIEEGWTILTPIRPGERPDLALEAALANAPREGTRPVLLVIDQLEEVLTLCTNDEARAAFNDRLVALLSADTRIHVVTTLRSDYEPSFARGALAAWWRAGRFVVPPMTREELREAIEKPAAKRVLYFDPPELVDRLIDEVALMPGALPLLSFTLSELFRRYLASDGTDRALTMADYLDIGGVAASVTEAASRELDTLQREDARFARTFCNVMLRLVSVEGGDPVRRRISFDELEVREARENERRKRVVACLLEARLLVAVSGSSADVTATPDAAARLLEPAHDVLVTGWEHMRIWIKQNATFLPLLAELRVRAAQWSARGRTKQWLWSQDPRLAQLVAAQRGGDSLLNAVESDFVVASERRRVARQRTIVTSAVTAAILLLGFALFALDLKGRADASAAEARKNEALAKESANIALDEKGRAEEARREAVHQEGEANTARNRADSEATRAKAEEARAEHEKDAATASAHEAELRRIDAEDGRARSLIRSDAVLSGLAVAMRASVSDGFDPVANRGVWGALLEGTLRAPPVVAVMSHGKSIESVSFSPADTPLRLLTTSRDHGAAVWSLPSATPLFGIPAGPGYVNVARFSPSGRLILTTVEKRLTLWDGMTGKLVGGVDAPDGETIQAAIFSNTRMRLAFAAGKRVFLSWLPLAPSPIVLEHDDLVRSLASSSDGRMVSASRDGTARVWDETTGAALLVLKGHTKPLTDAAFTKDGAHVVTTSEDHTARIWNAKTGVQEHVLTHDESVRGLSFSKDGERLATFSNEIAIWELKDGSPVRRIALPGSGRMFPSGKAVFRDNSQIVITGDPQAELWTVSRLGSVSSRADLAFAGQGGQVWSAAVSPDGKMIATGSTDGTARVWGLRSPDVAMRDRYVKEATAAFYANYKEKELTFSTGQDEILWQRTFDHKIARSKISPDNRVVAVVEEETFRVTFLDATRGQVLSASSIPKSYVFDLQLSANGALAAVAEFGTAHLLRVSDASEVRAFVAEKGLRQAVFAPGETLLVVRIDGMLDFWSTATGQRVRTLHETDLIHGLSLWPGGHLFQMNVGADTKIYETSTGRDIARIDPGTWGIQPTSDGKVLQVGFLEGHGMTLPELFAAGCMALRGVKALPSVTGAELDAVLQACRARKIDVDGTSVAAP